MCTKSVCEINCTIRWQHFNCYHWSLVLGSVTPCQRHLGLHTDVGLICQHSTLLLPPRTGTASFTWCLMLLMHVFLSLPGFGFVAFTSQCVTCFGVCRIQFPQEACPNGVCLLPLTRNFSFFPINCYGRIPVCLPGCLNDCLYYNILHLVSRARLLYFSLSTHWLLPELASKAERWQLQWLVEMCMSGFSWFWLETVPESVTELHRCSKLAFLCGFC